jgi:small-conductance mechanosensitive channel
MKIFHIWHGWFFVLFLACAALVFSNGIHWILFRLLRSKQQEQPARQFGFGLHLREHLGKPARGIFILTCLFVVQHYLPVSTTIRHIVVQVLAIAMVVALGWFAAGAIYVIENFLLRRFDVTVADNIQARRVRTQFQVFRRVVIAFIVVLTAGAALYTFHDARLWRAGTGLLASAGLASLVLATAAKSTASNFLAGMQIAFTQPIRLDDVVIVQGEYGNVEEINSAYVVIRCWDLRRLIVPLSYFIENSFQNWTRHSADVLGYAYLYLDYSVPIEPIRQELTRILSNTKLWDGRVNNVQITNLKEHTMEVRCLISAANAGNSSDLASLIREKMIEFVRNNYPQGLPRTRIGTDSPLELQTGSPHTTNAAAAPTAVSDSNSAA